MLHIASNKYTSKSIKVGGTRFSSQRLLSWTTDLLGQRGTIDVLPDDILLTIFTFHVNRRVSCEDNWHTLTHVCQRWRCIVFESPLHLNLRLLCTNRRPVRTILDFLPATLPIVIRATSGSRDMTNLIAALEEHNRICEINIQGIQNTLFAEMEMRFPALTYLSLSSDDEYVPVLTDSFLGGYAPRLQSLELSGIPFPALPELLLTTTDLVTLYLLDVPEPGFISPEAMVTVLSPLTKLQSLRLEFRSPRLGSQAYRASPHPLPRTRVALTSLYSLQFRGDSEYLEGVVAQIDAPLLERVTTVFFNHLLFDTPLLRHFISRTKALKALHRAEMLRQAFSMSRDY
jgi:F-box-like